MNRPELEFQRIMREAIDNVKASGVPVRDDAELYRLALAALAHDVEMLRRELEREASWK